MLTGLSPFGNLSTSEVVFEVLGGGRPSRPANALELGLSDKVWKLLEDCWKTERALRPSVEDVSGRVKAAALVCGTLSSVKNIPKWYEDPESRLDKFGRSLPHSSCDVMLIGLCRWIIYKHIRR